MPITIEVKPTKNTIELTPVVDEPIDDDCTCGDCDRCINAAQDKAAAQVIDDDPEPTIVKNSGPASASLMETTVKSGHCPNCGHDSASQVGAQVKCINCSHEVTLR
jgi:hypothetical protein